MKFMYLFLTVIMSNYAFTQENNLPIQSSSKYHEVSLSEDKKIDEESNVSVICYGKAVSCCERRSLLPFGGGFGTSLRSHNPSQPFGLQLDGNIYTLFIFEPHYYVQGSTSAIYYPFYQMGKNSIMSRLNLTCGVAVDHNLGNDYHLEELKYRTNIMLPVSIGYEGKHLFFDIGIPNLIPNDYNQKCPWAFQTVKVGIRF